MHCILCNEEGKGDIDILGLRICKICFEDISNTSVSHTRYEYYKEIIKLALKNYIYEKSIVTP
mgnify:CR=1 FL=1